MKHFYLPLFLFLFANLLTAQQVQVVSDNYVDIAYVDSRDQLYALRPAGTRDGSRLCLIDQATAEVLSCVDLLGEDPSLVRATTSGDFLYIAFVQSDRIVRIDLSTQQIDQDFRLGGDSSIGRFSVRDILPLRNSDDQLLVSSSFQCCGDFFEGVALIESGTILSTQPGNDFILPTSLTYTEDDRRIIGYDGYAGNYGLLDISIGDDNQLSTGSTSTFQEYYGRIEYGGGNRIYSSGGAILETDNTPPQLTAQAPIFNQLSSNSDRTAVEPVPEADRIYYFGYDYSSRLALAAYDINSLEGLATYTILPDRQSSTNQVPALERLASPTSFAALTGDGTLALITICISTVTEVPPPYQGLTTVCQGQPLQLTAPAGLLQEGQTIGWSDGQVGDTVFVTESGSYSYRVIDENGCPGPTSDEFFVGAQNELESPPFIQEPLSNTLCVGATLELIGSSFYENSIVWNTDERTDTLIVAEGGSYSARAINPNTGCLSEASAPITIRSIADSVPPAPTVDQGTIVDTCSVEPIVLSVSEPAVEYYWSVYGNPFATGQSTPIFYNFEPAVYSVAIKDFNGCISPATDVRVTYFQPPLAPTIQYNLTTKTLAARGTLGPIRWYYNDVFEAETQALFYKPKRSGFYTARVRGERCLSEESNQVSVEGVTTSITNLEQVAGIDIFPNPVHNELTISVDVPDLRGRKLHYELVSMTGSLVRSGQLAAVGLSTSVSVAELAPGMYVLRLRHGAQEVVRQRVVVF